jgi:putative hydrolase of the HAD superfamily
MKQKKMWKIFVLSFLLFFHSVYANAEIRAVIFDLGGVVVNASNSGLTDFLCSQLGILKESLPSNLKEFAADLEKGLIKENDFWFQFAHDRNGRVPDDWSSKWKEFYLERAEINLGVIKLIETLKAHRYRTPLLSDTMESHYIINLERGLFEFFEPVFNSIHTHLVKPDKRIYEYALRQINTKPEETVFIDDLKVNVEGAISVGIVGIQYISLDQLKADLRNLNIKID